MLNGKWKIESGQCRSIFHLLTPLLTGDESRSDEGKISGRCGHRPLRRHKSPIQQIFCSPSFCILHFEFSIWQRRPYIFLRHITFSISSKSAFIAGRAVTIIEILPASSIFEATALSPISLHIEAHIEAMHATAEHFTTIAT